jgi:hypothetical protein
LGETLVDGQLIPDTLFVGNHIRQKRSLSVRKADQPLGFRKKSPLGAIGAALDNILDIEDTCGPEPESEPVSDCVSKIVALSSGT